MQNKFLLTSSLSMISRMSGSHSKFKGRMQKIINLSATAFILIICMLCSLKAIASTSTFHHQMEIQLSPNTSEVRVKDHIQIPMHVQNQEIPTQLDFFLHAGLTITDIQGAKIKAQGNEVALKSRSISIQHYTLTLPPGQNEFTLHFNGKINHPLQGPGQEYSRSFGSTPGVISPEAICLATSSAW